MLLLLDLTCTVLGVECIYIYSTYPYIYARTRGQGKEKNGWKTNNGSEDLRAQMKIPFTWEGNCNMWLTEQFVGTKSRKGNPPLIDGRMMRPSIPIEFACPVWFWQVQVQGSGQGIDSSSGGGELSPAL